MKWLEWVLCRTPNWLSTFSVICFVTLTGGYVCNRISSSWVSQSVPLAGSERLALYWSNCLAFEMRRLASVCCERARAMAGWYATCSICRRLAIRSHYNSSIRWFKWHFPALPACIWILPNANKPSASAALHWTAWLPSSLPKEPQPLLVNNWTRFTLLLLLSWRLPSSLPKEPQPLLVNNWTRFTLLLLLSWSLQLYKRRFFSTRLCGIPWPPGAVLSMKQKRYTWWIRRRDRRNWELQLQPRKPCSDQKQNLEPEHSLLPDPEGRHEWT